MLRETAVFCLNRGDLRVRIAVTRQPLDGVVSLAQVCLAFETRCAEGEEGDLGEGLGMQGLGWREDVRQRESEALVPLGDCWALIDDHQTEGETRGLAWEQQGRLLLPGGVSVVCGQASSSAAWLHEDQIIAAGRNYSTDDGGWEGAWHARFQWDGEGAG